MTGASLKAALARVGLSQRAFAILLGKYPDYICRLVARQDRDVPGPVAMAIRVYERLSPEERVAYRQEHGVFDVRPRRAA